MLYRHVPFHLPPLFERADNLEQLAAQLRRFADLLDDCRAVGWRMHGYLLSGDTLEIASDARGAEPPIPKTARHEFTLYDPQPQ